LNRLADPAIRSDLARIEMDRPLQLLTLEVISGQNGAFVAAPDGPIHSDFFPELEFRAQEAFFVRGGASAWTRFDENYLTRPSTLLGSYLKDHSLTEADLKAIVRYQQLYHVPDEDLINSILHRWRRDFPGATLPLELSTKLSDHGAPAELETQRYRALRQHLFALADKDPVPLRVYAGYVMKAYRTQRSVFFTPQVEELEGALRKLIETDSENHRVYKLYQAELAWDRGDDATCLALGLEAFTLKTAPAKASDFKVDATAPLPALRRMIETLWRARRLNDARELCRYTVASGFAQQDIVVAALCRKVLGATER